MSNRRSLLAVALAAAAAASSTARPLPSAADMLSVAEIERVLSQAVARAQRLGVNATIALIDREGNALAVLRTTDPAFPPAPLTSTISAGGVGGLEGVAISSAILATTKAGTAAFLSTSGNAFTTRTAGYIIQPNFPPGIAYQDSGPLFGVQFSSLPTSDINRLPLGLAADPGGVPLYRNGQVVAGVGVELDGVYTVVLGRSPVVTTAEEAIAQAAQAGFAPPTNIAASQIFVDGLRLAYSGPAPIPSVASLGPLPDLPTLIGAGRAVYLVPPRVSPDTMFATATFGAVTGEVIPDLAASRYQAVAVGEGVLYAAQQRADLSIRLVSVAVPGPDVEPIRLITGAGSMDVRPGESVVALAHLDGGTPGAAADDRVAIFTDAGKAFTMNIQSGAASSLVSIGEPNALPRDAAGFFDGADDRVFAIGADGQAWRIDPANLGAPASYLRLTHPADGSLDSIAVGPAGFFAIRADGAVRELIRIDPAGLGAVVLQNLTDGGPGEVNPGLPFRALAYDDRATADPADDRLVAQVATLGRQLTLSQTGAVVASSDIADPAAALSSMRTLAVGADRFVVGPSRASRRIWALPIADPADPTLVVEATPSDAGSTLVRAGAPVNNRQLTQGDVSQIISNAHALNDALRAQIRRDRPQRSQVTVAVVDARGELIGCFRTADAPVFGFDVAVQKARTAASMSSPAAATLLSNADAGAHADYVARMAAIGLNLDGSVAFSDRTGGFLARPFIPDGLPVNTRGPLAAPPPEEYSPFNTGLQTALLTNRLVDFLTEFAAVGDDGAALAHFDAGLLGGGGVADPSLPLRNGLQVFPGSVPLYKNGVLVGGIGVSGDGIEQDDFVAFSGAVGFQQFGSGVQRADFVFINLNGDLIRLPYVKFPRVPFGGF
ncbi:MAG: heme-binding protein [Phycisphaerales bacterium]|nr:heme-binding protein [Phycisphaerales bacterium]